MNLLCGPSDILIAMKEGNKGLVNVSLSRPGCEPDLHRRIGLSFGCASGFEIDGGKDGFANLDVSR
jgi:hypothetical protein